MTPLRRLCRAVPVLATAAALGLASCGENDVERGVEEGAKDAEEAAKDAGKAGKEAAKDAEREVEK